MTEIKNYELWMKGKREKKNGKMKSENVETLKREDVETWKRRNKKMKRIDSASSAEWQIEKGKKKVIYGHSSKTKSS